MCLVDKKNSCTKQESRTGFLHSLCFLLIDIIDEMLMNVTSYGNMSNIIKQFMSQSVPQFYVTIPSGRKQL